MAALKVTYKNPQLKPRARKPRTHTAKQIKIAASIKEFGFISPILIDGADVRNGETKEVQRRTAGADGKRSTRAD